MPNRRSGGFTHLSSGALCYSGLFHAGRLDALLAVLVLDPTLPVIDGGALEPALSNFAHVWMR
jgi:hypothetical protein